MNTNQALDYLFEYSDIRILVGIFTMVWLAAVAVSIACYGFTMKAFIVYVGLETCISIVTNLYADIIYKIKAL